MAKPTPYINFDIEKMFLQLKLPGIDMDAIISSQRTMLHKATEANAQACEALGAIASRTFIQTQESLLREGMDNLSSSLRESFGQGIPHDKLIMMEQLMRGVVERFIRYLKEGAEMAAATGAEEAIAVMNKNFDEVMGEVQTQIEKGTQRSWR